MLLRTRTFSPEILSTILRFYLNLGRGEFLHIPIQQNSPNPLIFALVCREWREITFSRTPGIWSFLHIELPETIRRGDSVNIPPLISRILERSHSLPVTIRLFVYPTLGTVSYVTLARVFSIILAQAYRWQDFVVMATPRSLPLLLHSTVFASPVSPLIPWNVLQSLNFSGTTNFLSYSACAEILRSCSSLKHCMLAMSNVTRYGEIFPETIDFPHLEYLHLIEAGIPDHAHPIYELFVCPNLRELTIVHEQNQPLNSQQLEYTRISLLKLLEHLTGNLYLLRLFKIPLSETGLFHILTEVPERLTHLVISHRGNGSPITDNLLFELTLKLPSSTGTPLHDDDSDRGIHCPCSACGGSSVDGYDSDDMEPGQESLHGYDSDDTGSDQESLPDHPIFHTLVPELVDISVVSNDCSGQAIEDFLRSRWNAVWHVSRLQHARFDLLERMVEPDLHTRVSDCCAAGLVLQVGDA